MSRYADRVQRALDRGTQAGLSGCAIYLPGEDVRCICPGFNGDAYCTGVLFTNGPESVAHVRIHQPRAFHERRKVPRGSHRCQRANRHKAEHWLDVEGHMAAAPMPSSAA